MEDAASGSVPLTAASGSHRLAEPQSLRGTREFHAVDILNEINLMAEMVGILDDSAEDLKA